MQEKPMFDGSLLLTIPEAASELRIHRNTVYELITQQRLPAVRLGSRMRIRRSDLENFVQALARVGSADACSASHLEVAVAKPGFLA
ncbi:helix-turn-helix domain-containing protein [Gryllotalpicola reticulitermitis]|uniref:Helix-turn-helix domain-containing protein n=1 Tax=Gryllotalpicola reticulitermitis TaxID=1184153 RepID=A0ABV8QAK4_9MICO